MQVMVEFGVEASVGVGVEAAADVHGTSNSQPPPPNPTLSPASP